MVCQTVCQTVGLLATLFSTAAQRPQSWHCQTDCVWRWLPAAPFPPTRLHNTRRRQWLSPRDRLMVVNGQAEDSRSAR
ncbi:hypothetical protein F5883DRAFT_569921 [Diaporthe sp. PMI_573]|nr:hypothetical protein F5883DRAFT_569921 [Diaporthaceae sp. PMI_573]